MAIAVMEIDALINRLAAKFAASATPEDVVKAKLTELTSRLFPLTPPLPKTAPELWDKASKRFATPRDFVEEIYKPWLKTDLSWPYLHKTDRPLYHAVRYQLVQAGIQLKDFLPTKSVLVQRELEQAGPEGIKAAARIVSSAQRFSKGR